MNKKEKEALINRKIGFNSRDGILTVEGIIKNGNSDGLLIEITKSLVAFYKVGSEYFIPFSTQIIYKFL